MKIGKLTFKDYAAKKPIMVSPSGKFVTIKEVSATPTLQFGSLHTLSNESKVKLTLERYKCEPDFKLGIFEQGIMTKAEILKNIQDETPFGKLAVQVEMQYCNELVLSLKKASLPAFPKLPDRPLPKVPDWRQIKRCFWFRVKNIALFCENTTDSVTGPFALYRIANVHNVFAARGFNVVANIGNADTRINFVNTAKKPLTAYLSGIGHGNYDLYTGHAGEIILKVGAYDAAEVKDKAIHFLSCRTAAQLGPNTITKGARCYAGYDENFTFVWDNPATPVNELDLFKKSDSIFDIYMAYGFTAQQAYNAAIATFNASIAMVPGTSAASWLSYDRDHLRLLGDPNTKILPYRFVKICLPLKTPLLEEMLVEVGDLTD
jgi:hypothetical protein